MQPLSRNATRAQARKVPKLSYSYCYWYHRAGAPGALTAGNHHPRDGQLHGSLLPLLRERKHSSHAGCGRDTVGSAQLSSAHRGIAPAATSSSRAAAANASTSPAGTRSGGAAARAAGGRAASILAEGRVGHEHEHDSVMVQTTKLATTHPSAERPPLLLADSTITLRQAAPPATKNRSRDEVRTGQVRSGQAAALPCSTPCS
jgi:hypothetical protein